jgi:hypothetical protein
MPNNSFEQEYQQTQSVLGKPLPLTPNLFAPRSPLGTSGWYRAYESGAIYQSAQYGAVAVTQDARREYVEHGSSSGWLVLRQS